MEWQDIASAPKEADKPILVWFDHEADSYYDPQNPMFLTDYAANAEAGDFLPGKGVALAVWRDGYNETESWESGISYWVPGGWFAWFNGDAADHVVKATHWMPVPESPSCPS